jgi:hypothetical protein
LLLRLLVVVVLLLEAVAVPVLLVVVLVVVVLLALRSLARPAALRDALTVTAWQCHSPRGHWLPPPKHRTL